MQLGTRHHAGESPIPGAFQERDSSSVQQAPRCRGLDAQNLRDLARREREPGHTPILKAESLQRVRDATVSHRNLLGKGCVNHATPIRSILQQDFEDAGVRPAPATSVLDPSWQRGRAAKWASTVQGDPSRSR